MLNLKKDLTTTSGKYGMFIAVKSRKITEITEIGSFLCDKICSVYRSSACWQEADTSFTVPAETQFLMMKKDGGYTLVFALSDGSARTSLFSEGGVLKAETTTYDAFTPINKAKIIYIISGDDPYVAISRAYEDMEGNVGRFKRKNEASRPDFCNYMGFCTYNALLQDVGEERLLKIEKYFAENGAKIKFIIADDGWHTHEGNFLASFYADREKYPQGLKHTIDILKKDYGLEKFFCWHAYNGYWQGVKCENFKDINAKYEYMKYPEKFSSEGKKEEELNTVCGTFYPENICKDPCGMPQGDFYDFYSAMYSAFKEQGVDGTKLDAMAWLETFSEGKGGRSAYFGNMMNGLEKAATEYFGGEYINCSSCTNDFFYATQGVGVTRVSADYYPDRTETYFNHFLMSALTGMWTEPIVFCDWDMFQSRGKEGRMHAKARAISGAPVYISDNENTFSAENVLPLISQNGFVAKCMYNAALTEDCLFLKQSDEAIIKLFNRTEYAYVSGALNCFDKELSTEISLSDVRAKTGKNEKYLVYSDERGAMGTVGGNEKIKVTLSPFGSEIISFIPFVNDCAVIGLKGKYNPTGFISEVKATAGGVKFSAVDDGVYLVYKNGEITEKNCAAGEIDF